MPFVRHYLMIARPEEIDTLRRALEALAAKIAPLEGCEGTELYQDADKPERFVFLERWQSSEHQKEGGKALGKEAFAPILKSEEHTSELQSLMRISYADFCFK